ncbi:hypothetical protein EON82_07930 [bacterium]|nr:MAG: hypothetical protein EON82_07930 [bacterium]
MVTALTLILSWQSLDSVVGDADGLMRLARAAAPGTTISLRSGEYRGGIWLSELHGTKAKPIVIRGLDPKNPPKIVGGSSAIHLSEVSHLVLQDLVVQGAKDNGINVDDGGTYDTPSHHVTIRRVVVSDLPKGNHDGIKLSGVDDLTIDFCRIERWGGSAIDMVGCHRALVTSCEFVDGGDSGVQCKGGSSDVTVEHSRFYSFGQRGVNAGGSTGSSFFRPPIASVRAGKRYEAKNVTVQGCVFSGGIAPIAFVGVDGATFRFNTIDDPERWAFRILQETASPDFVHCRNGVVEDNLIVFKSDHWASGGINIGADTQPETFHFARNFWYCSDRPQNSRPQLPTFEKDGVYGQDPRLLTSFSVRGDSPAANFGAHAWRRRQPAGPQG